MIPIPNKNLRKAILLHDYTQKRFAIAVGVSESYVSKVANGYRRLPEDKQKAWARVLGCEPQELFQ